MARPGAARSLFVAGASLLAAHATLLIVYPHATLPSNLFIFIFPVLGVTVCLLGAYQESPETRPLWLLLGCGFLLAAVGQLESTYYDFATHMHSQTQALNPDFLFFAYGIPIMLAICSRGTDAGLKIFAWLDGAQGLIAAVLAYLLLFSVLPSQTRPQAISATNLMYLNNAENWILVGAVTLRFFSHPSPARKRFYRALSLYLWLYGVVALVLGYLELKRGWRDGLQDVAWGIPYLPFLGSFALQHNPHTDKSEAASGPWDC